MNRKTCRQNVCCVIKLIVHEPRSHSDLVEITEQRDAVVTRTLRALVADELIEPLPRANRRAKVLYRWCA